jgi:hypothetical protein
MTESQWARSASAATSAPHQQPITTNDVKNAINLRNRLHRVRQRVAVASAIDITSGPVAGGGVSDS